MLRLTQMPDHHGVAITVGQCREVFLWQSVRGDQGVPSPSVGTGYLDLRIECAEQHAVVFQALTVQGDRAREDRIAQLGETLQREIPQVQNNGIKNNGIKLLLLQGHYISPDGPRLERQIPHRTLVQDSNVRHRDSAVQPAFQANMDEQLARQLALQIPWHMTSQHATGYRRNVEAVQGQLHEAQDIRGRSRTIPDREAPLPAARARADRHGPWCYDGM
jgi:hypothetical protein